MAGDGNCAGCGGTYRDDEATAMDADGYVYHEACRPSDDPRADQEYWQGRREANQYVQNKQLYGEELAEQWEIERELQEDDY